MSICRIFILSFITLTLPCYAKAQTMLVMGDSLSAAYGIELEQGWVNLLHNKLDRMHNNNNPWRVINASVSGETTAGALAGITRAIAMKLASDVLSLSVKEENFTAYDLYIADEVFLTGTAAEIIPVVKIDSRIIGTGHPGKVTQRLMREFRLMTETEGTQIKK